MKPHAWHGMSPTSPPPSPSLHHRAIVILFNAKFHNSIQHPLLDLFEFVCLLLAAPHNRPSISSFVLFSPLLLLRVDSMRLPAFVISTEVEKERNMCDDFRLVGFAIRCFVYSFDRERVFKTGIICDYFSFIHFN